MATRRIHPHVPRPRPSPRRRSWGDVVGTGIISHKNIINLYRRHATAWTKIRSQTLFEQPWLDRFLAYIKPCANILDIGCGSGQPIAQYLLDNGHNITGVDTSDELLKFAASHMPQGNWINADMRNLNLDAKFDGILAWHSLFHLQPNDQRAMFPIFQKHANSGAPLIFTSGTSAGIAIGEFQNEPLYHASLAPAEYRSLLSENHFDIIAQQNNDATHNGHIIWLARHT